MEFLESYSKCPLAIYFTYGNVSFHVKEQGIPDYLTRLLKNLYAGPEATVRIGHETRDWFKIGKGVYKGCT